MIGQVFVAFGFLRVLKFLFYFLATKFNAIFTGVLFFFLTGYLLSCFAETYNIAHAQKADPNLNKALVALSIELTWPGFNWCRRLNCNRSP